MSGTHRDLLFGSKSRCFACKNHRWGLGPIETSNSYAKVGVFHAQNDRFFLGLLETCYSCLKVLHARWGLGPIETSNSCAKVAVFDAQNYRFCLALLENCYSGPKVAVLHAKKTHEGWDPWRLVILMLSTLFCMHKTTGESWNQYSLFNLC